MVASGLTVGRGKRRGRRNRRRRRVLIRVTPLVVLAVAAFVAGVKLATGPGRDEKALVRRYVVAWQHNDVAEMYGLLDSASRSQTSEIAFARRLQSTEAMATLRSLRVVKVGAKQADYFGVRVRVDTRLWGAFPEILEVGLSGSGSGARVHLQSSLLFPGLKPGEALHRQTVLAPRASLLASDGTPLAEGPDRTSPIPGVAIQIVGTLGPIPHDQAAAYAAQGYPAGAKIGRDGLERIFQSRLVGRPGGKLLAGHRVLAGVKPTADKAVKTTINPTMEQAAVSALGGQYAGMAVMDPRSGGLEALAGIAFSALQPPGSTMKIITTSAALAAGIVKPSSAFAIESSATIDGFTMQNAGGEECGGTLVNAFAVSCNSVFAPLGVKLGGARLVAMAEKFGFNQPSSIVGAAESMIPSAPKIGDALAVGSSAIGQGDVLTTPLEMTDVAATIAMGGRRPIPTLLAHQKPRFVRVLSPAVAHEVQQMMIAVVQYGTGTAAQIPGVVVAGKTGTAELTDTGTGATTPSSAADTDAWFVGYAPVGHPHVVAGALFPGQGAGGATAAPAVQSVIASALGR